MISTLEKMFFSTFELKTISMNMKYQNYTFNMAKKNVQPDLYYMFNN